jgi:hypothetical protein
MVVTLGDAHAIDSGKTHPAESAEVAEKESYIRPI